MEAAGEDGEVQDGVVAAWDGGQDGAGAAEGVVVCDARQAGQAVGAPEDEAEVQPDLVAVVEAKVRDEVVPARGEGEDDEGDVEQEEGRVEVNAERQGGEGRYEGQGDGGDDAPVLSTC